MRKQRLKLPFRTAVNNFTAVLYKKKNNVAAISPKPCKRHVPRKEPKKKTKALSAETSSCTQLEHAKNDGTFLNANFFHNTAFEKARKTKQKQCTRTKEVRTQD